MINIKNKVDCCGCKACGDVCSKKAITFITDVEGFWYPEVNNDLCVECGLCEKVCPLLNPDFSSLGNSTNPDAYILQAPCLDDRLQSASGAAYTLLARVIFDQGGYVAGHIWNNKSNVVGYVSGNPDDLSILRGTKYLQSDVEGMYISVRGLLNDGKLVLFSGCPCQNAAMRRFLRKDYDNLIMTDFTCMGIDTPFAFAKYIESLENKFHSKITYFKAKSKEVGWRHLTNKAIFESGKTYFGINHKDANLKATFLNVLVRPSCYECKFKGLPRVSDITIGDYWRNRNDYDSLDDNTGTSYTIIHNNKACVLFEKVKPICYYRQVKVEDIFGANPLAIQSLPRPTISRNDFYERLHKEDFTELVEEYYINNYKVGKLTRNNLKTVIRRFVKGLYVNRSSPLAIFRFLYYNFFSSVVLTNFLCGDIIMLCKVKLDLARNARLKINGICNIGDNDGTATIKLGKGSFLTLDTNRIESGTNINLQSNSSINVGYRSVLGHDVTLKAQTKIEIGDFCLIHDGVQINDTDGGVTIFNGTNQLANNISIGTHTLICRGALIKGSTIIGDETIVKEYSVVKEKFAPRTVIAGNPARVIDNNKYWKFNF